MESPQVFVYRWGINDSLWHGGAPSKAEALEGLRRAALENRTDSWRVGATSRTPVGAKKLRVGDVLLFYAGQKFTPGRRIYGVGLAGLSGNPNDSLAVRSGSWKLPFRWLPISRQLARHPFTFEGIEEFLAPQGPSSTLLHLKHPPKQLMNLVRRSTRDASPPHSGRALARNVRRSLSAMEGTETEIRISRRGRSRLLRDDAIDKSRGVCEVCNRDFSKLFSGAGCRVLQVHHRRQLSALVAPRINKSEDLAVVCANCHSLIHLDPKRAMRVGILRRKLNAEKRRGVSF